MSSKQNLLKTELVPQSVDIVSINNNKVTKKITKENSSILQTFGQQVISEIEKGLNNTNKKFDPHLSEINAIIISQQNYLRDLDKKRENNILNQQENDLKQQILLKSTKTLPAAKNRIANNLDRIKAIKYSVNSISTLKSIQNDQNYNSLKSKFSHKDIKKNVSIKTKNDTLIQNVQISNTINHIKGSNLLDKIKKIIYQNFVKLQKKNDSML